MTESCGRAFKEWKIACDSLKTGEQTLLIRKGGIREDGGTFVIEDKKFWLMPTFEHQNREHLLPHYAAQFTKANLVNPKPDIAKIECFAVVDSIWQASNEDQVNALCDEMIWNDSYVKLRFDFNPYDPLYLVMLRVYNLAEPVRLPMLKSYGGCKSWINLGTEISIGNLTPAISGAEFLERRNVLTSIIEMLTR